MSGFGRSVALSGAAGALGAGASFVWSRDLAQAGSVFVVGTVIGTAIAAAAARGDDGADQGSAPDVTES